MCHRSHVTCLEWLNIFCLFGFLQHGEASRWRVCYQPALHRIVFMWCHSLLHTKISLEVEDVLANDCVPGTIKALNTDSLSVLKFLIVVFIQDGLCISVWAKFFFKSNDPETDRLTNPTFLIWIALNCIELHLPHQISNPVHLIKLNGVGPFKNRPSTDYLLSSYGLGVKSFEDLEE